MIVLRILYIRINLFSELSYIIFQYLFVIKYISLCPVLSNLLICRYWKSIKNEIILGLIFGEIIEVVGILPLKKNDSNIWIEETPWLISSMIFEGECLIFINQWNPETCIFKTLMNKYAISSVEHLHKNQY